MCAPKTLARLLVGSIGKGCIKINGRKRLLRVDIEPNGKLQIQSGGGKDSIVDFRPDLSKPLAPQIDKAFKRLPQSVRDELIRNAEKGLKRLQETGNM